MTADTPAQAAARESIREWFTVARPFNAGEVHVALNTLGREILALCSADPLDRPSVSERQAREREREACEKGWLTCNGYHSGYATVDRAMNGLYPAYPPAETWVEWTRSDGRTYRTNGKVWEISATISEMCEWPVCHTLTDAEGSAAAWRAAGGK